MTGFTITGFSDKDIPPRNDPKWDEDNETYRIVHGQPIVRIPFIKKTGLKIMSIKNLLEERIKIYNNPNNNRDVSSMENKISYMNLTTSDAVIGNPDKGEIKIIHNNPIVYTINENSNFLSWTKTEPELCKDKTKEEIKKMDKENPRGCLEIPEQEYQKMDGLIIKLNDLEKHSLINAKLREKFFDYILEGDKNLIKEYLRIQKEIKEHYREIPIRFYNNYGLNLMTIEGIRFQDGPELSSIRTENLTYFSSDLATQHTEKSKKKNLESKADCEIFRAFG